MINPTPYLRAAEPPTILVMPFHVISQDQPELMIAGIEAFLNSRLISDTCSLRAVPIINGKTKNNSVPSSDEALAFTQEHNGDFLIYGTVVKFGETLTTDAFLFDRAQHTVILHFNDMGTGNDVLLTHLNEFSKKVLSLLALPCYPASEAKVTSSVNTTTTIGLTTASVWKSPSIKGEIFGLATGDLDGDHITELVLAQTDSVSVWDMDPQKKTITQKAAFPLPRHDHVAGVDLADINGNGRPEIFVSLIQDDHKSIDSLVLEWDGTSFQTIRTGLKWVFRRHILPDESTPVILAQKNVSLSKLLGSPIQRLTFVSGNYDFETTIHTPLKNPNLYSFTYSKSTQDTIYAMYSFNNRLNIYDSGMNLIWESDETYGGSTVAMSVADPSDKDKTNSLYLEPRLMFHDLDGDEANELISIKNHEITQHLFSGMKNFNKGQIVILKRSDFGFVPLVETEPVTGHITDFALTDHDSETMPELIYSVVNRGKNLFSKKTSTVVFQTFRSNR